MADSCKKCGGSDETRLDTIATEFLEQTEANTSGPVEAEAFDKTRAEIFDKMADTWDRRVNSPSPESLAELLDSLRIEGKIVLNIGSGTGVLLSAVGGRRPEKWIACDLSQRMLEILGAKHAGRLPFLELLRADAHSLPLDDDCIDVVICNGVFPHFHDKRRALLEIRRVLRPGGTLVINHFISREEVNRIHSSSEAEILRGDLLCPAGDLAQLLSSIGFTVTDCIDTDELYRVSAIRAAASPETERSKS